MINRTLKFSITLWLCSTLAALSSLGNSIAPVIVQVIDSDGNPIAGAMVEIKNNGLEKFQRHELDPKSNFTKLAQKASGQRTTDTLGSALTYCAGKWALSHDSKQMNTILAGLISVRAQGYKDATLEFKRSYASEKIDSTELILRVTIMLKPAT